MDREVRTGSTRTKSVFSQCAAWLVAAVVLAGCASVPATDPLPSWNEGATKAAIVKLVSDTTRGGSPDFVPPPERIATFDNDGTLWTEHPMYVEVLFTLDRIKAMAASNPAWRSEQPFKAVIEGDRETMAKFTEADFFKLIAATHAGLTSAQFQKAAADWLAVAKNARFNRRHTELVYQPMLELLAYFRANGYKTFIVTGGTLDFVRSFAEKAYGVPPEQVVGTSFEAKYAFTNGVATVVAEPKLMLLDDGPGKADRHRSLHRACAHRSVRQFRRRSRDAADDDQQPGEQAAAAAGRVRLAHGRRARVRVRPRYARRPPRPGTHARAAAWLVPHRHEEGLEGHLPVRAEAIATAEGLTLNVQSTAG